MSPRKTSELEAIQQQFGFTVETYRIGEITINIAQIDHVNEMILKLYPEAVTTHGDAPVWMITWPAAFGLAEYLLLNEHTQDRRALELGCGTAAPSIALERAGAKVVCTDCDPLALALAEYNSKLNQCRSIAFRLLDWYQPDLAGCFDLVVGSEVVYCEKHFQPLLSLLERYLAPGGHIVLADPWRPLMDTFQQRCRMAGFRLEVFRQMVYLPEQDHSIRITILTR